MARERRRRGVEVKEAVKAPAYIKRKIPVHDPEVVGLNEKD